MNNLRVLYRISTAVSFLVLIVAIISAVSFVPSPLTMIPTLILNLLIVITIFGVNPFIEIKKLRNSPDMQITKLASWLIILGPTAGLLILLTSHSSGIFDLGPILALGLIVMGSFLVSLILNIYYLYKFKSGIN